jgi:DNA-binding CsgD family transcriptional regulator
MKDLVSAFRSPALVVTDNLVTVAANRFVDHPNSRFRDIFISTDRRLVLKDTQAHERLKKVIAGLKLQPNADHGEFILVGRPDEVDDEHSSSAPGRTVLHVLPLESTHSEESGSLFLLLFRRFATRRKMNRLALKREFGLSNAECLILEAMVEGTDLAHYAREHGLALQTVRNQLRNAASKIGLSRQAEIAALMTELTFFASIDILANEDKELSLVRALSRAPKPIPVCAS